MHNKVNMKKLFSAFLIALACHGFSQKVAFEKKTKVIDINANFGVYNTVSTDSTERAQGKNHQDKAAPYGFALSFEYGVLDWLGIGLKGQACTYLSSRDTSGVKPDAKVKDIALVVNFHLVRKKRFDLLLGGNIGYSGFKFSSNDSKSSVAKGGGLMYDIHVQPRLYFSEHFGMYLSLSYIGYSYSKLKLSDNVRTYTDHLTFKGSGVNVGIGFQVQF
jgi:hypothetical protein